MAQGTPTQLIVAAVAAACLIVVAAALFALGLRGRRIDDHPVCRRCRFDLLGIHPGAAACPECGADLARPRAVRTGQRRRRRGPIWTGAICLLLVPALLVACYAAARTRWTAYRLLPVSWLMAMVDPESPTGGEGALRELARRAEMNMLAADTFSSLIELTLERQASVDLPWSAAWGDPLAQAFSKNALTAEQLERYVRAAMTPTLALRSPVAAGEDQWPVGFEIPGARVGSRSYAHPTITAKLVSARVDGAELDLTGRGPMTGYVYLHAGTTSQVSHHLPLVVEPGVHPVRMEWIVEMQAAPSAAMTSGPAIADWPLVLEGEVEVLPVGTPVVALVTDESLRAPIEAMIFPQGLTLNTRWKPFQADGRLVLRGEPPMPLAFEVFWRVGEREWRVGSITTRPGIGESNVPFYGVVPGFDPATTSVDLILRPSPAEAVQDREIDRIWGGEIIVRDVPIAPPVAPVPASGG